MPLTEEQRLRLEENKRKAIEKRKQMQNQSFHGDGGSKQTKSNQNLTGNLECNNGKSFSSIQTEEQRLRMEENKRKAIEKRNQLQNQTLSNLESKNAQGNIGEKSNVAGKSGVNNFYGTSNQSSNFSSHTEEQRLRMEENKRKAIEKRNQLQSKTFPIFNGGQSEKSQSVTEKSSVQNFYGSNDKKPNSSYQAQNSRCLSYVQSYES